MRSKFHLNKGNFKTIRSGILSLGCFLAAMWVSLAFAGPVELATARRVADNTLRHHVALYGDWNGTTRPVVAAGAPVVFEGGSVAYNFAVHPSGHVLVAVDDLISPVLLYSTRSAFDPSRAGQPQSLESWIIPETHRHVRNVRERAAAGTLTRSAGAATEAGRRIARAWAYYAGEPADAAARGTLLETAATARGATVGPLLTTTWHQIGPYNLQTPEDTCGQTLTGCVATAWAQLMRYWRWPITGTGTASYVWTDSNDDNHTLSVDFDTAAPYEWDNMPSTLSDSTAAQKDAVSLLMYHVGVAAEMQWGCSVSASSAWADEVLPIYFRYQAGATYYGPAELSGLISTERFAILKAELDADPPRPAILSIFTAAEDVGHEVVVDGYQTTDTGNFVHINFGWEGSYDGYFNFDNDIQTDPYTWEAQNHQFVVGIQPDNDPPVVDAGADQSVNEATQVQLSGSATDPEAAGMAYRWTQTSGPAVTLANATTLTPIFTAPGVSSQTNLVFQLRADDLNRAWAADTVTVTVANTGGGGGGGGGGCFILSLGAME